VGVKIDSVAGKGVTRVVSRPGGEPRRGHVDALSASRTTRTLGSGTLPFVRWIGAFSGRSGKSTRVNRDEQSFF
jgi:hypothetical protein